MKVEMTNISTFDDVLLCYSGRRLQFAIKLGILPQPETLRKNISKQVLNGKAKTKRPVLASRMMRMSNTQKAS